LERYVIAKNKEEDDKMLHYADIIQECQDDLGLDISSFPDIGKSALAFHSLRAAQIVQTNKSNNEYNHNQEQVSEEDYPTDSQYEQERYSLMHIVKILEMIIMKRAGLVRSHHHTSQLSDVFVL
jgi:hypothetical protein